MNYPIAGNEPDRLAALNKLKILDTKDEPAFNVFTTMLKNIFDVPMVAISLVAEDRQWFKSEVGICARQTDRDVAFCNYTIMTDEIFEVPDTHLSDTFKDNPLVTGAPYIRYYCGAPIYAAGFRVGALCIIDDQPRLPLEPHKGAILSAMAGQVGKEIENRRIIREAMVTIAGMRINH